MGKKFSNWKKNLPRPATMGASSRPDPTEKFDFSLRDDQGHPQSFDEIAQRLLANRGFSGSDAAISYGDFGIEAASEAVLGAIRSHKRIALYADYDVDGTMSCVSWIWFFRAIGYDNFLHYIPCRFSEGYGLNLSAIQHLVEDEKAEFIITMDTGITANQEAAWCKERGVGFLCTDHHVIQPDLMPDCIILNPKMHEDPEYQDLCGCGITFVLLRRLGRDLKVPAIIWTDLLALTGMATICDVVPLGRVNHYLARQGAKALSSSRRPVLRKLLQAAQVKGGSQQVDEKDVGFRLGPRINAVGRLEHAKFVIDAFVNENPDELIAKMGECNERRKAIQREIVAQARVMAAQHPDAPVLFLGGDWHPGVVGIAASKIAEEFWRPVWLFQRKDGKCKGSARAIPGFDVSAAMFSCSELFEKCGGHHAAGGFTFDESREAEIRARLEEYARGVQEGSADIWTSATEFDLALSGRFLNLKLMDVLDGMKPFGHGFAEPRFLVTAEILDCRFYKDKQTGEDRHTAVQVQVFDGGLPQGPSTKILFFNEVHRDLITGETANFLVSVGRNSFRGQVSLSLYGHDFQVPSQELQMAQTSVEGGRIGPAGRKKSAPPLGLTN